MEVKGFPQDFQKGVKMVQDERYIWIEEAVRRYGRSRDWFSRKIREGKLRRHGAGDERKVYLECQQVEQLLAIHPVEDESKQS